jgi:NlpC/P60 family putative phage cell wall peptidase
VSFESAPSVSPRIRNDPPLPCNGGGGAAAIGDVTEGASNHILTETRRWLGTPYRHQASTLHAGCDCLGLVRGVWRALNGVEPETPPPYRPDWAEAGGCELLLEAFGRWLVPIPLSEARPGDALVFRMAPGAVAKHCAILSAPDRMIHAYWGRACVESALGRWWRERRAAAFRFPSTQEAAWPR